jgi:hypothetical protein
VQRACDLGRNGYSAARYREDDGIAVVLRQQPRELLAGLAPVGKACAFSR